jgi:hypothetical protein
MADLAGADVSPEDDDFTVAQDTEFDEREPAVDDDHRPLDDALEDEVPGVDEERRVDLRDDRVPEEDED